MTASACCAASAHVAASAVNVELDRLLVLSVQVQHRGDQLVAQFLVNRLPQEDDSLTVLPHAPLSLVLTFE